MTEMQTSRPIRLSKSKVIAGRQCLKRLWLQVHNRQVAGDTGNEMAISIGHDVGDAAQGNYPAGVLLGSHEDFTQSLQATRDWAAAGGDGVGFEATFQADGVLVMADIVEKRAGDLHLIEVKASTSVKDYHRDDVAVQAHVLAQAGHSPASVHLRVINNQFIYRGDGDYRGLFRDEDLTAEAKERSPEVSGWIREQQRVLAAGEPDIPMGVQCNTPYACEFQDYCRACAGVVIPEYPVTMLPYGGRLANELQALGYTDLRDVPAERLGSHALFLRIHEATRSGREFLSPEAARELANTCFPRYYLDFEGIAPAVPRWADTRPYQQLPFQWSLHVEQADGSVSHCAYLHTSADAPMRPTIERLLDVIGDHGTVFVYNQSYEGRILREMATMFPDLAERLLAIPERFVDLLKVARNHYYHPAMKGSWSIKAVLPSIDPELAYDTLGEVQEGSGAQEAFMEIIDPGTVPERKAQLVADLERYCAHDTWAMVRLVQVFSGYPSERSVRRTTS